MFIDEPTPSGIHVATTTAIPARALLRACAQEAERHARQIAFLDEAFGTAIAPAETSDDMPPQPDRLLQVLHRRLQQIDSLRQEAQGLAAILHLLASAPMEMDVPTDCIRTCTPLVALRDRLMSAERTASPGKMTESPDVLG